MYHAFSKDIASLSIAMSMVIIYSVQTVKYMSEIMPLKVSKWKCYGIAVVSGILFVAIRKKDIPYFEIGFITYLYLVIVLFFVFEGKKIAIFFSAGNIIFQVFSVRILSLTIMDVIFTSPIKLMLINEQFNYILVGLEFFGAIISSTIFMNIYDKYKNIWIKKSEVNLKQIYILQSIINVMFMIHSLIYYIKGQTKTFDWVIIVLLLIGIYYTTVKYTMSHDFYVHAKMKNEFLEEQINKQIAYYEIQKEHMNRLKKFKHDYKKMMEGVAYLIKKEDLEGLREFINEMNMEMREVLENYKEYSNHPLIQAILWDAQELIKKKHIRFNANIHLPHCIRLSDVDICRVLLNILENSIEACEKIEEEDRRFIEIRTIKKTGGIVIEIENSFNGEISRENNKFKSLKQDEYNHGIGLENIREIIEKYKGIVNIQIDKQYKRFKLKIYLPEGNKIEM